MSQYLLLKSDGDTDSASVGLVDDGQYEGGVLGANTYSATINTDYRLSAVNWFDTSTLYANRGHPETQFEMDRFFDAEREDVSFGGAEDWNQALAWDDDEGTYPYPKPSYLPGDGFSFELVGEIYAPEDGTYQFGVDGDDAVDVYIDGQFVTSWYGGHGPDGSLSAHSGSIDLTTGWHTIVSRHEEGGGGDAWAVGWNKPNDSSFSVIPESSYRPPDRSPLFGSAPTTSTTSTEEVGVSGVASLGSALFSARGSPVDTSTTLSADTTLTTANGTTSVGNILLQVSAVQQQAVLSSVAGDQTVGSAVAEAVEGTALSIETVATFANSAVVSLGQVEGAQLDGVAAGATADVFAVLSAQSATAGAQTASLSTETQASALAQDATHAPLTPTMSIVIRVESSDLRVDGKFSDSLAASVGAQTFIKVAKTVGSTDTFESTGTASATPLLAPTTALLTGQAGDNTTTTSTLGALPHEFAGTGLVADPPTSSGATGSVVNAAPTDQVASGSQSSSRGGTRTSTTPTALTSVANTAAVSDIAPTVASALVQSGIVDSKADAAAAVAHLVARTARDGGFSTADAAALLGEVDTTNLTARTASFFLLFASLTGVNEATIENESTVADLDESRTTVTIME
jgi:hypothetical protein